MTSEEIDRKIELCHKTQEYIDFLKDWKDHPYRTYLMQWDYDVCIEFWDSKERCGMYADFDDEITLHPETDDIDDDVVVLSGLKEWKSQPIDICIKENIGEEGYFDWDSWNKKGIELAHKLRELLPNEYTLYYSRPFEDYEDLDKPPVLIT